MGYYQEKQRAFREIEKMLDKGATENDICYCIAKEFGFSEKFCREAITIIDKQKLNKNVL